EAPEDDPDLAEKSFLVLWDLDQNREQARLPVDFSQLLSLAAYRPDGRQLAVADLKRGALHVFDAAPLRGAYRTDTGANGFLGQVAWHPDNRLLTSSIHQDTLRVWELADESLQTALPSGHKRLTGAAYSPDGRWLLVAGTSSVQQPLGARLLDASTGAEKQALATGAIGTWLPGTDAGRVCFLGPNEATVLEVGKDGGLTPVLKKEFRKEVYSTISAGPDGRLLGVEAGGARRVVD